MSEEQKKESVEITAERFKVLLGATVDSARQKIGAKDGEAPQNVAVFLDHLWEEYYLVIEGLLLNTNPTAAVEACLKLAGLGHPIARQRVLDFRKAGMCTLTSELPPQEMEALLTSHAQSIITYYSGLNGVPRRLKSIVESRTLVADAAHLEIKPKLEFLLSFAKGDGDLAARYWNWSSWNQGKAKEIASSSAPPPLPSMVQVDNGKACFIAQTELDTAVAELHLAQKKVAEKELANKEMEERFAKKKAGEQKKTSPPVSASSSNSEFARPSTVQVDDDGDAYFLAQTELAKAKAEVDLAQKKVGEQKKTSPPKSSKLRQSKPHAANKSKSTSLLRKVASASAASTSNSSSMKALSSDPVHAPASASSSLSSTSSASSSSSFGSSAASESFFSHSAPSGQPLEVKASSKIDPALVIDAIGAFNCVESIKNKNDSGTIQLKGMFRDSFEKYEGKLTTIIWDLAEEVEGLRGILQSSLKEKNASSVKMMPSFSLDKQKFYFELGNELFAKRKTRPSAYFLLKSLCMHGEYIPPVWDGDTLRGSDTETPQGLAVKDAPWELRVEQAWNLLKKLHNEGAKKELRSFIKNTIEKHAVPLKATGRTNKFWEIDFDKIKLSTPLGLVSGEAGKALLDGFEALQPKPASTSSSSSESALSSSSASFFSSSVASSSSSSSSGVQKKDKQLEERLKLCSEEQLRNIISKMEQWSTPGEKARIIPSCSKEGLIEMIRGELRLNPESFEELEKSIEMVTKEDQLLAGRKGPFK